MNDQKRASYIRALLVERGYYVAQNLPEKVAAVDAELARVGHDAEAPVKRAARRAK